jgi:hypothetical protein
MGEPRRESLFDERDIDFTLLDALDGAALCHLPDFAEHSRQAFKLFLGAVGKLARERWRQSTHARNSLLHGVIICRFDGAVQGHQPCWSSRGPAVTARGRLAYNRAFICNRFSIGSDYSMGYIDLA